MWIWSMETSQFEGKKIALKQTKDGYAMTLAIHPDEVPSELLRDFVGARYMVVMVRLADNEEPLNREEYAGGQLVKKAGMICRDPEFWKFMEDEGLAFEMKENQDLDERLTDAQIEVIQASGIIKYLEKCISDYVDMVNGNKSV